MPRSARAIEPSDLPSLADFLARIYRFDASDYHVDTKLLEWKYLRPRSCWDGSRSYVIEKGGHIVAHCGVCPVRLKLAGGAQVEAITMTDWAADPLTPGVGSELFRKLMAKTPVSFVVGGAPPTRQILPRIGFRQVSEAFTYSKWLRPWREFCSRPRTGKALLRLLHGLTHFSGTREQTGRPWTFAQVNDFGSVLAPILTRDRTSTACRRTLDDLNYLLECPQPKTMGYLLLRGSEVQGYFIVAKRAWEARLLDMVIASCDLAEWRNALCAVTRAVHTDPEICRIRAQSTIPVWDRVLASNGYFTQYSEPIFVHDLSHALDHGFPVDFQLCDGDAGY